MIQKVNFGIVGCGIIAQKTEKLVGGSGHEHHPRHLRVGRTGRTVEIG